ncbi:TPA: hypothetical protein RFB69_000539 [Yersinia enterocolitica]|nr:hypothetical protein [Yersinia enterocolitica]ELI8320265.1 hypothetical protein [Yersinia enterocolitica]ELW7351174.1 hypothetical protein [Yersinia enterocolitica]HDL8443367.1 hypothetical protein [Yersinia enterocolitica]HDU2637234.1 hypothetical protein [Yersinia enterocolitica]
MSNTNLDQVLMKNIQQLADAQAAMMLIIKAASNELSKKGIDLSATITVAHSSLPALEQDKIENIYQKALQILS